MFLGFRVLGFRVLGFRTFCTAQAYEKSKKGLIGFYLFRFFGMVFAGVLQ